MPNHVFFVFIILLVIDKLLTYPALRLLNVEEIKIVSKKYPYLSYNIGRLLIISNILLLWFYPNPVYVTTIELILIIYLPFLMIRINGKSRRKLYSLDLPKKYVNQITISKLIFNGGHFITCLYIIYRLANA